MKHIQITNLEHFTAVFSGQTLRKKRELLDEAARVTVIPLSKDREHAVKLAESLARFAGEISGQTEVLVDRLKATIETLRSASGDFTNKLAEESLRLSHLALAVPDPVPTIASPLEAVNPPAPTPKPRGRPRKIRPEETV